MNAANGQTEKAPEQPDKKTVPVGKGVGVGLTPELALKHIDAVCAKYEGTRHDHLVLQASIVMLRGVVEENARLKAIEAKVLGKLGPKRGSKPKTKKRR
jgi:hypothetical protein